MTPLFILGAPKCATTSLYEHLARHPSMDCPAIKEPGYFTRDRVRPSVRARTAHMRSFADYVSLYDRDNGPKLAWCDASTSYLRSPEALAEIRNTFPQSRAVAVVRDPVDLVSSYFTFLRHERWEEADTLEEAWELCDDRARGRQIPEAANRPDALVYSAVAQLGTQVRAARRIFGADLLVLPVEDLFLDLPKTSREVQLHAGLTPTDLGELPRANPARSARSNLVNRLAKQPPPIAAKFRDSLKRTLGVSSLGVRRKIESLNSRPVSREPKPATVCRLRAYFEQDVEILCSELGIDFFSMWGWRGK